MIAPDAHAREVRVSGWTEGTGEDVIDAADVSPAPGVQRLLVTDIGTDGMLDGPERRAARRGREPPPASRSSRPAACRRSTTSVALAAVSGIEGAIVGKALYVGAFDLGDAIKAVAA